MMASHGRWRLTLAALAVFGVLLGGALARADDDLTIVERATSDAVVDLGAAGDSAGDLLTFANEVYDADNAKLVGSNNGMCIRTVVGKAWECYFTNTLAEGQIMVEGPFYDGADSVMAVTGGTGEYAEARGEMTLHARNPEGTEYDFVFRLED